MNGRDHTTRAPWVTSAGVAVLSLLLSETAFDGQIEERRLFCVERRG